MTMTHNRRRPRMFALILSAGMALSACQATTGSGGAPAVGKARVSFTDTCAPLRRPFQEIRAKRDQVFAANIAGGALSGALLGALVGGDRDKILAGAIVGGLAGAAQGYAQNAASRGATEASLARFADRDARREASQNDTLVNTLLRMNACRLDQAEKVAAQARSGAISKSQAQGLLRQVRSATKADNRIVNSVAGSQKSYNAYVGVLSAKDIAAANRTRRSVASYTPTVRRVTRTSRGGAAINAGARASGATGPAQARNSAKRLDAVNDAHVESVNALIGNLDIETPT